MPLVDWHGQPYPPRDGVGSRAHPGQKTTATNPAPHPELRQLIIGGPPGLMMPGMKKQW
jgi:hypothetical protein